MMKKKPTIQTIAFPVALSIILVSSLIQREYKFLALALYTVALVAFVLTLASKESKRKDREIKELREKLGLGS